MNAHEPRSLNRIGGVTLIELLTAIMVLGILLGVAVPAFSTFMRENSIAATSNSLVSALALARSESVKRGVRVSVCSARIAVPPPDPPECSEDPSWANGWILFADDFGAAGVIDPTDEILQTWPAPPQGINFDGDDTAITFMRTGRAEFPVGLSVSKHGCGAQEGRAITIELSGRVSIARENC